MLSKLFVARVALAAVSCAAATVAVGVGPAQAAAGSTTVSPAGASVSGTNQGPIVFTAGPVTVTCNTVTTSGSVPAAPNNQNPSGSVSVQIAAPTISDCSTNLPGALSATVTTSGTWGVSVQNGSPIVGNLLAPAGGVTLQTSGALSCTAVLSPDSPATVAGTFTNGNPSTVTATDVTVPVKITGDAACPSPATATTSATFALNNTTDPSTPITVSS
ncbi:hypothetical protein [Nocardia sp. NPDC051570]|uniref:hypothetical protein n=1 Tax=Nocardia sp. NPDC051570 TaxID=3364324 RepID=UPI0037B25187